MRLKKAELKGRVNANLELRFSNRQLTSHAGLELVRRYFAAIDLRRQMRRGLTSALPPADYGIVPMLLAVLALMISGGRRVRHLMYLESDPIVLRLCGLRQLPTARSVGRWLREFRARHLPHLQALNADLVAAHIERIGLKRLTVDVDGSVVSTGQKVQWAHRGFNPHRRKVPSYYPITAFEAQSGQVLRVQNRPGNVHDGKASVSFLHDLFAQIKATLGGGRVLEFRMDGAFFRREILQLIERRGAEYAIKVPFYPWLNIKGLVQQTTEWSRVDETVSCAEHELHIGQWNRRLRVILYRKRVGHKTAKNFQLDLFDPADGHFEYSAVATNKTLGGRALWQFMCGRGTHEKAYGELKSGFAFDCVPTMRYAANSAWQLLSVMAFNLMRGFQVATTAELRAVSRKRRCVFLFEHIETLRFRLLHRAGLMTRTNGVAALDIGGSRQAAARFMAVAERLEAA